VEVDVQVMETVLGTNGYDVLDCHGDGDTAACAEAVDAPAWYVTTPGVAAPAVPTAAIPNAKRLAIAAAVGTASGHRKPSFCLKAANEATHDHAVRTAPPL
jgi:hypothetical protein